MRPIGYVSTAAAVFLAAAMAAPAAMADGARGPAAHSVPGFTGKAINSSALDGQRGGHETLVINDMKVDGSVTDNTATHNITGTNTISNAFTGASGLPIVVQNSGNNVLIQNATIVNLEMH